MIKIAEALAEDPLVRDWIIEQGYKLPEKKETNNGKNNIHSRKNARDS